MDIDTAAAAQVDAPTPADRLPVAGGRDLGASTAAFRGGGGHQSSDICRGLFRDIPDPLLPAPAVSPPRPASTRTVRQRKTMEAKRSSMRLVAEPSSVPVSQRAQQKLMRELDFLNSQETEPDAAVTAYVDMYGDDLPKHAVKAIRAATRMGNKKLAKVLAALAKEADAADMEVQWMITAADREAVASVINVC
ncbi:uncharacterized protein [Miscanthus floridulus]|uniref:uncharacterized protein n=1 Tax=Miscanthus floridulus TaxID=154761 RepID=UPI00345981EB